MRLKTTASGNFNVVALLAILFFSFYSSTISAQCAGDDAELIVCDIPNVDNKSINLFNLLGPNAIPGGIWTTTAALYGFTPSTGILNAWLVNLGGIYTFTYNVSGISNCPDPIATVTVTIGGFSGVPSPDGAACSNESSVNLFRVFSGQNNPPPKAGGTWTDDSNTGALIGSSFDATMVAPEQTYTFTYLAPTIGSCVPTPATINVYVYRAPKAGVSSNLNFCETDDLTGYTNFDLRTLYTGEDDGGTWTEATTAEIENPNDSFINIQNIYQTFGPGIYDFTYRVASTNPICVDDLKKVSITIEEFYDLSNAVLEVNSDICDDELENTTFSVTLTNTDNLYNALFDIKYKIVGPGVDVTITTVSSNATDSFFIIPPEYIQEVGTYTITLFYIKSQQGIFYCPLIINASDELHIYKTPSLSNAAITIPTTCVGSDGIVQINGIGNLDNGSYQITYNLVSSNKAFNQVQILEVNNGTATFAIPSNLIPNIGSTTLFITSIINLQTGCDAVTPNFKTFIVAPLPFVDNITVTVPEGCQTTNNTVTLTDLGTLTNTAITYNLSGANNAVNQTATFTAVLGNGTFVIPGSLLPNVGETTITITSVTDLISGCSISTSIPKIFIINPLPDVSNLQATINVSCKDDPVTVTFSGFTNVDEISLVYSLSGANTISNQIISLTAENQSAGYIIPPAFLANSGTTTFSIVSIANTETGCISPTTFSQPFTINPLPDVAAFSVTVPTVCQNEPVNVVFSNLGNVENLTITYSLSGANTVSDQIAVLEVTNGASIFVIPSNQLSNTGTTNFLISNIENSNTDCKIDANINRTIQINPLPIITSFAVAVADACKDFPVTAQLSGLGNLTAFSIVYSLSGANMIVDQLISLNANSGNSSFVIPPALIPNSGTSTLSISILTNTQTNCGTVISNVSDAFTINFLPIAPTASDAFFCQDQNPTIADLLPTGNQFKWYDSDASTTVLSNDTALVAGDYFVSETNPTTGCESFRTAITVSIRELETPTLNTNGQNFCGADNPTIANLTANANADEGIAWYDAAESGALLSATELLLDNAIYYGFNFSETTGCMSADPLIVTVSLTDCDDDDDYADFFIPDGFSPNGDTVNDTFRIPDIEFLYPDYTLEIYNRYGHLLFRGNSNKPAWDGNSTAATNVIDNIAPNGVYFYVINFNKNNKAAKQGRLYLNR